MKRLLIGSMILIPCLAHGQTTPTEEKFPVYLQPYEPTYAVWRWASSDKQTLNAHYSFRYLLTDETVGYGKEQLPDRCVKWYWRCDMELFGSFTGEFDFYMGTRDSSPVINRVSNPALHARWVYTKGTYVDLAFEHRSNGQTTDVNQAGFGERAERAYLAGDRAFFDTISRNSNFFTISAAWRPGENFYSGKPRPVVDESEGMQFGISVKHYVLTQEHDVNWGPLKGTKPRFADYDRLRLGARFWFDDELEFGIQWMLGDKVLKTDSLNVGLSGPLPGLKRLHLYLRYHQGPMHTLSNYTQSQRSFGIGLKFVPSMRATAGPEALPTIPHGPG